MFNILSIVPGKKKLTQSGWHSFNAVCCHHRGHKPDTRMRGGIKVQDNTQTYHCFNCGFSTGFTLGKSISESARQLLIWCGIDEKQIQKWNLESLKHKDLLSYINLKKIKGKIKFKEVSLPNAERIDINNPSHKKYVNYLSDRAIDINDYSFYITPNEKGRNSNRIIVPYTYNNKIVGYTSRYLDNKTPKYINEQQLGYVFGMDFQKPNYEVCILVEGIFDALSLNACAIMHNTINEPQSDLLSKLNRKIIFVPDQDKTGLDSCETMLELGYSVSIPNWERGVKDVNDAVVKYGKLPTLLSILENATSSKIKVELQRRKIERRI